MIGAMKMITPELLEDGAKCGEAGRRLMGRERIAQLLAHYDNSGLSMAAFARREGLKYPTFASWVKKHASGRTGEAAGAIEPARIRFAQVRLPAMAGDAGGLSVTLPGGLVLRGADPLALAALVRALGAKG
jgi:transposase-like protein